jgi:alanyl-tRNA synthetase
MWARSFRGPVEVDGAVVLAEVVEAPDAKALLALADRAKGQLGDRAAIVLGTAVDGRVHLVASVTPALVERGLKAGTIVREAAQITGGGGRRTGHHGPGRRPRPREAGRGDRGGSRRHRGGAERVSVPRGVGALR